MHSKLALCIFLSTTALTLIAGAVTANEAQKYPVPSLLAPYESGDKLFKEVKIKDKFIVYYHQRTIDGAIVEKDRIVYQFDGKTRELRKIIRQWRDDIPERLPPDLLSVEDAAWLAEGEVESAILQFISPKSCIFELEKKTSNPCWIIRKYDENGFLTLVAIDAVNGEKVGTGVMPSYNGFSMVGPDSIDQGECKIPPYWAQFSQNAWGWFEDMGYPSDYQEKPSKIPNIRDQIKSNEVAVFYELAHSFIEDDTRFANNCIGTHFYEWTYGADIGTWMLEDGGYDKMVFTFLHSCYSLCGDGSTSLSYNFRDGADETSNINENTAVVGYCCRPCEQCWICANESDDWQYTFFNALIEGATVEDAFDQACAVVPECLNWVNKFQTTCVCLHGDGDLTLVPTRARSDTVSWEDSDTPANPPLGIVYGWGVAWADYDNDGDADLLVANYGQSKLFRNKGNGLFEDSGLLSNTGNGLGATWGDYDNDGDLDLYLANDGANKLYKNLIVENQGQEGFQDVTSSPLNDSSKSYGASWGDYDNDGRIDLCIINDGASNKLIHNEGNGTFADSTSQDGPIGGSGHWRAGAWGDYDNDLDLDLYIVSYTEDYYIVRNELYRNDSGSFTDVTETAGVGDAGSGMMAAWGDYNNDGYLDLYVVNDDKASNNVGNKLFRNNKDGTFEDVTAPWLGFDKSTGWATAWGDYDNDGDIDLYAANCYGVYGDPDFTRNNRLYRNDCSGSNERLVNTATYITGQKTYGTSVAWADYDNDGDPDLYLTNLTGTNNRLLINNADEDVNNNWLKVKLEGTESNWAGIGARVRITIGFDSQIREISGGSGRSQNDLTASFGLGSATKVDVIEVFWPGPSQYVNFEYDVAANQTIVIEEHPQPYAPNCDFAFAENQPSCPFVCPSGDHTYSGRAPIRLEATLRDYRNNPVQGWDDFYISIAASDSGTFSFCCADCQPTVLSSSTMAPSDTSDSNGKAYVDIFWGGGYDQALELTCFLDDGPQIGNLLSTIVRSPDLNADCAVNQTDVNLFYASYQSDDWWADLNCSGWVDLSDLGLLGLHNGHDCGSDQTTPLSGKDLAQLDKKQQTEEITGTGQTVPDKLSLSHSNPNPFNPATKIRYAVPKPGAKVIIEIFDVTGTRVKLLEDKHRAAGRYEVTWNGTDSHDNPVSSGVYFYRLKAGGKTLTKKMVLLK